MVIIDFFKKYKYLFIALVVATGVLTFAFISGGRIDDTPQTTSTADISVMSDVSSTNSENASITESKAEPNSELDSTVAVTEDSTKKQADLSKIDDSDNQSKQYFYAKSDSAKIQTDLSKIDNSDSQSKQNSYVKSDSTTKKADSSTEQTRTEKDKYKTDPVPEGKPEPVEPQEQEIDEDTTLKCTFSISCETILNNLDMLDKNKLELVPEDAWILKPTVVEFSEGESVFDVLVRICKDNKIHMEYSWTPIFNSAYIEGIGNLYEIDCGSLSGWMYRVNDWFPNYGCSRYELKSGDTVEWKYTCDLGYDIGGGYATGE